MKRETKARILMLSFIIGPIVGYSSFFVMMPGGPPLKWYLLCTGALALLLLLLLTHKRTRRS